MVTIKECLGFKHIQTISSYGHQSLGIFVKLLVQFRMIQIQTIYMIFDPQFKDEIQRWKAQNGHVHSVLGEAAADP